MTFRFVWQEPSRFLHAPDVLLNEGITASAAPSAGVAFVQDPIVEGVTISDAVTDDTQVLAQIYLTFNSLVGSTQQIKIIDLTLEVESFTGNYTVAHEGGYCYGFAGPDTLIFIGGSTNSGFGGYPDLDANNIATGNKIAYAGNVITASTSLGTARANGGSIGNSTHGVAVGGYTSSAIVGTTEEYTFASDTVAAGGSFAQSISDLPGSCGTPTVGVLLGGRYNNADNRAALAYTYADNSVEVSSALASTDHMWGGGFTSDTHGFVASGWTVYDTLSTTAVTDRFNYSAETFASTTSLSSTRRHVNCAAGGSRTKGMIAGGFNQSDVGTTNMEVFTFADSTWANGASLGISVHSVGASRNPWNLA